MCTWTRPWLNDRPWEFWRRFFRGYWPDAVPFSQARVVQRRKLMVQRRLQNKGRMNKIIVDWKGKKEKKRRWMNCYYCRCYYLLHETQPLRTLLSIKVSKFSLLTLFMENCCRYESFLWTDVSATDDLAYEWCFPSSEHEETREGIGILWGNSFTKIRNQSQQTTAFKASKW